MGEEASKRVVSFFIIMEVSIMSIQKKINKLIAALLYIHNIIIKIKIEDRYSILNKKVFKMYRIIETTEEEILLKQEYYRLLKECKKKNYPPDLKKELLKSKEKLEKIKKPSLEFFKKIDVLVYLVKRFRYYEELIKDEK